MLPAFLHRSPWLCGWTSLIHFLLPLEEHEGNLCDFPCGQKRPSCKRPGEQPVTLTSCFLLHHGFYNTHYNNFWVLGMTLFLPSFSGFAFHWLNSEQSRSVILKDHSSLKCLTYIPAINFWGAGRKSNLYGRTSVLLPVTHNWEAVFVGWG